MPLKCTCPRCGKLHRNIDKKLLGKKFQCDCGKVMRLGGPPEKQQPAKPSAKTATIEATPANSAATTMVSPTRIDEASITAPDKAVPRSADKVSIEDILKAPPAPPRSTEPVSESHFGKPESPATATEASTAEPGKPEPTETPAPALLGSDFADVDDLIGVHDMGAPPVEPEVIEEDLPIAEPVDSASAEMDEIEIVEPSGSLDAEGQSFEVLDDSEEDVIDLSDGDVVIGPPPSAGARLESMPAPPPEPVVAERVFRPPPQPAAPTPTPNQPTLTSMNPAYKAFGPPPPAHYPVEPPVPDGASAEASVGAAAMRPGLSGYGGRQAGVSVEAILALIAGILAVIFGLWVAYHSYQIVSYFLPGSGLPSGRGVGMLSSSAGILAFIYGFRLLTGLGLLVGGCLFFINEIIRLNGSDPMPYSCIIALIAGCCFLLVEFAVACYGMFNQTAMSAYGINVGANVFLILLFTFLKSLIPIALIVFAALRQR